MEIKDSLPCSPKPVNCPQPQTEETNPRPPIYAWVLLNSFIQVSPSKFCIYLFSRISSTRPAHLILQDLSTQIIFGETYEWQSFSLREFYYPTLNSHFSGSNTYP